MAPLLCAGQFAAGGESGAEREREKAAIEIGRVTGGVFVRENGGDGKSAKAGSGLAAATGGRSEVGAGSFGGSQRLRRKVIGAAFDDGLLEKIPGRRRLELREDAETARRFAENGDVQGIATEEEDVVADPAEGGLLVHQAVVAGEAGGANAVVIGIGFLGGESGMSQEAKSAEPVVNGDDDDTVLDHRSRVVIVAFAGD